MGLPSEEEIWQRVKSLEKKVIPTIEKGKENGILSVSDFDMTIKGRSTRPTREDVRIYCEVLTRDKIVTKENRPQFGWSGGYKTGRIIMAILAAALPEYVQSFGRKNSFKPGLSGIRLTVPVERLRAVLRSGSEHADFRI